MSKISFCAFILRKRCICKSLKCYSLKRVNQLQVARVTIINLGNKIKCLTIIFLVLMRNKQNPEVLFSKRRIKLFSQNCIATLHYKSDLLGLLQAFQLQHLYLFYKTWYSSIYNMLNGCKLQREFAIYLDFLYSTVTCTKCLFLITPQKHEKKESNTFARTSIQTNKHASPYGSAIVLKHPSSFSNKFYYFIYFSQKYLCIV